MTQQINYETVIYNHLGIEVHRSPRIADLRASIVRNDIGTFSLGLVDSDATWASNNLDPENHKNYIVQILRHMDGGQTDSFYCYFIRRFNPRYENSQFYYYLSGVSPEWLLTQKMLVPEQDARYNAETARYITESGNTSEVIAENVEYHLGSKASNNRGYNNISVVHHGVVGRGGGRWDFDVLMDEIQELALSDDVDFSLVYIPENNMFEFNVGRIYKDRQSGNTEGNDPFILSNRLGNLYGASIEWDYTDEKTVLWIRQDAASDAERRLVLKMQGDAANIPYNKIEFEHNNTRRDETETNIKLITQGRAMLKKEAGSINLEADFTDRFKSKFRKDWDLGDKITVEMGEVDYGFQISEVELMVSGERSDIVPKIVMLENNIE